jgi:hypothetical protein
VNSQTTLLERKHRPVPGSLPFPKKLSRISSVVHGVKMSPREVVRSGIVGLNSYVLILMHNYELTLIRNFLNFGSIHRNRGSKLSTNPAKTTMCYHEAPSAEEFLKFIPKTPGVLQNYSFKIAEIPFKVTIGTGQPGKHLLIFDTPNADEPGSRTVHTIDSLDSVEEVCRVWKEFLKNPHTFLPPTEPEC